MKLKINIDGKQYEADIEVLEDEHVESNGGSAARSAPKRAAPAAGSPPPALDASAAPTSDAKTCRSTIAGIVVQVFAAPGNQVAIGDKLLVLEAMKMESNVVATVAGVVKAVHVAKADSVKKGQVLVEFE
jgi:methylmalonyl-CoA carboxyltransferase small subunit